jgi:UDP-N-acetylmuramoyl-L-alanyl-D-glutamate--2,6-diaminopimelate ligase
VIAVNSKSEYANRFASHPANQKIFYAHDAALHATNLTATSQGSSFDLVFPDQSVHPVQLNLPGDFNVENALAAAAVCYGLGITPHIIADGLTSARPVPGRMENLSPHKPFNIIVDYAHTPDGFEKALSAARSWTSGRLIPVFGAAGNRLDRSHDHSKRPLLAAVAAKYADHIILTEEDPGIENPAEIIEEIQAGIPPNFNPTHITTILNRKDAIRHAISQAQSGDTIILLAMGAQTTMATKEGQIPYNEREFVRSLVQPDVIN